MKLHALEYSLREPGFEKNVRRQTAIYSAAALLQLASFICFFHLLSMIARAVPTYHESDEAALGILILLLILIWWFLNLPTFILLLSVYLSHYTKWARKYQKACGIVVIVSGGLTMLFEFIILTLFWPDGFDPPFFWKNTFSFSAAQWLLYLSMFLAGIVYMSSGIIQLRRLSPPYTDEIYLLQVRSRLEEQMVSWRIRSFESGRFSR